MCGNTCFCEVKRFFLWGNNTYLTFKLGRIRILLLFKKGIQKLWKDLIKIFQFFRMSNRLNGHCCSVAGTCPAWLRWCYLHWMSLLLVYIGCNAVVLNCSSGGSVDSMQFTRSDSPKKSIPLSVFPYLYIPSEYSNSSSNSFSLLFSLLSSLSSSISFLARS